MRGAFSIAVLLCLCLPLGSLAASKGFGVGVIVGEPTGVSVKNWMTTNTAFDAAAAWSFTTPESFQFHADHLWHKRNLTSKNTPLFYGIGGRFKAINSGSENARLGVRFPLGVSYLFREAPFDVFLEVAPILDLVPSTDFTVNAAFGTRFYIGR